MIQLHTLQYLEAFFFKSSSSSSASASLNITPSITSSAPLSLSSSQPGNSQIPTAVIPAAVEVEDDVDM